jgi:hypothetical protein
MSCRDEILEVLPVLRDRSADGSFTPQDVVDEMRSRGTSYSASTIRTHVTSRMCANAPDNHAAVYDDLERVGQGLYRLKR